MLPNADDTRVLSDQYQLETSVTIMDDGPHLDLTDWKHGRSDWGDLERIDERRFRLPTIPYEPPLLPDYTIEELIDVVHATGGERWSALARKAPQVGDGAVGVGVSTLRIRVLAYGPAPTGWVTLFTVEIEVPMGC